MSSQSDVKDIVFIYINPAHQIFNCLQYKHFTKCTLYINTNHIYIYIYNFKKNRREGMEMVNIKDQDRQIGGRTEEENSERDVLIEGSWSHCGIKGKSGAREIYRNPLGCLQLRLLALVKRMPEQTFPCNHIGKHLNSHHRLYIQ